MTVNDSGYHLIALKRKRIKHIKTEFPFNARACVRSQNFLKYLKGRNYLRKEFVRNFFLWNLFLWISLKSAKII